jgi:DNA-binding transcriptional LysR family regulator
MSEIENRLLRYFVAVAEEQHFGRAALCLGISPPTLTHQIKKLENDLGAKLLERNGNTKVLLTDAGRRFLPCAHDVLRQVEEATAIARQAGRGELGRIQLGFINSVSAAGLLRGWINAFEEAHPTIDITVQKLLPIAQIGGILRNELDCGFTRMPRKYPQGVRGFEVHRQSLLLALPSGHPLARRETIRPAMLAREAFISIAPELDLGFLGYTEAIARIGNFVPHVVKRDNDFIAVLAYVALGRGVAVVPELLGTTTVANVVFRKIAAHPAPETSVAFIYGSSPSPSGKLLIRYMQRHALRHHGGSTALPGGSAKQKRLSKLLYARGAS